MLEYSSRIISLLSRVCSAQEAVHNQHTNTGIRAPAFAHACVPNEEKFKQMVIRLSLSRSSHLIAIALVAEL
jgi:hypothetical protein